MCVTALVQNSCTGTVLRLPAARKRGGGSHRDGKHPRVQSARNRCAEGGMGICNENIRSVNKMDRVSV